MITTYQNTETGIAFELGRSSVSIQKLGDLPFVVNPTNGNPLSLESLLPAPLRIKANPSFDTIESFIEYVNSFKEESSAIYATASLENPTFRAVIDHSGVGKPKWENHEAKTALRASEALKIWLDRNGKALDQVAFAELLESRSADITQPDAAEMIEIAKSLHVSKNSSVNSVLRNGAGHTIKFNSDQQVKAGLNGEIDIPIKFVLLLKPYRFQTAAVEFLVRLRVKIKDEHPVFVFEINDLEDTLKRVIDAIVQDVKAKTNLPVYL